VQGGWVGGWVNATPVLFVLMELHAVHYWVVALQCKCSALCKVDGHGASPVRPRGTACSVLRIVCVQHGLQSLQSCHTVNIKGPPYLISCVGWMKVVPVLSILKAFTRPQLLGGGRRVCVCARVACHVAGACLLNAWAVALQYTFQCS